MWAWREATLTLRSPVGYFRNVGEDTGGATGWSIGDGRPSEEARRIRIHQLYTLPFGPDSDAGRGHDQPRGELVSISDVTVTEGTHKTADFVVSLSRATSGPVSDELLPPPLRTSSPPATEVVDYEVQERDSDGAAWRDRARPSGDAKSSMTPSPKTSDEVQLLSSRSAFRRARPFDRLGKALAPPSIVNADPLTISIADATAQEGTDETGSISRSASTGRPSGRSKSSRRPPMGRPTATTFISSVVRTSPSSPVRPNRRSRTTSATTGRTSRARRSLSRSPGGLPPVCSL